MDKTNKLQISSLIIIIGFGIGVIVHYIYGVYLERNYYPYNTYLFQQHDKMADFFSGYKITEELDPFHKLFRGYGRNYTPFGYLISIPFSVPFDMYTGLLLYIFVFFAVLLLFIYRYFLVNSAEIRSNLMWLFSFAFLTYPVQFAFDRQNIENMLFVFLVGAFWAYLTRRFKLSAVFVGAACAAKIYPGIFALIFLAEKKYKEFALTVVASMVLTLLAMLVFTTSASQILTAYQQSLFSSKLEAFVLQKAVNIQHSVGILACFRAIAYLFIGPGSLTAEFTKPLLTVYSVIVFPILIIFVWAILSKKTVLWEKLTLCVAAMLLLPQVSFDYKLIHLLIPFALFLNTETKIEEGWYFTILFSLLFIPKSLILFEDVRISVVLNPMILVAIALPLISKAVLKNNFLAPDVVWAGLRRAWNSEF